ncbi:MAG: polysaccharide biosynthesis/export family protein [Armatimonadetes bacterium]|nr:polysaccharide biosynthesis/export family protein [Armatimonadota bacterium]
MRKISLALMLAMTGMLVAAWGQVIRVEYRLVPEDVISIRVFGEPEMLVDGVPVGLDGKISVPLLGFVKAAGLTMAELENYIRVELINRGYLVDPKITVNIIRFKPLQAKVIGMARQPGQYMFRPGDRLLDLLAQAGGALLDGSNRANLKASTLVRRGSVEQIPLDLEAMLERGDLSQNYELEDGDVINIPETAENRVNILGYVMQPRQIVWRRGMTMADVLAMAGGEVPYRGRMSGIQVQRLVEGRPHEWRRLTVDFTRYLNGKDSTQNIEILPGDVVYVPSNNNLDLRRASQIAGIAFTIQSLLSSNFSFFPGFGR